MERSSLLLRGVLDVCLLALLQETPCYGYEIVRRLAERGLSLVAEGSIYPVLARLEAEGLIEGYWEESPGGGPRRKYYRLLPGAGAHLRAGRKEWEVFRDGVDAALGRKRSRASRPA